MTPLKKAKLYGLTFQQIDKVVNNATKSIRKAYTFTGCYTLEDLYSTGWLGAISAINQEKFGRCHNKLAYIYVFARGYMTHALHRKSRMVKVPWEDLKTQKPGTAHLSYSWENLPEPAAQDNPDRALYELVGLLSDKDAKNIISGKTISPEAAAIVEQIKQCAVV